MYLLHINNIILVANYLLYEESATAYYGLVSWH